MKKIFAIVLIAVMVMMMGVCAMAENRIVQPPWDRIVLENGIVQPPWDRIVLENGIVLPLRD